MRHLRHKSSGGLLKFIAKPSANDAKKKERESERLKRGSQRLDITGDLQHRDIGNPLRASMRMVGLTSVERLLSKELGSLDALLLFTATVDRQSHGGVTAPGRPLLHSP